MTDWHGRPFFHAASPTMCSTACPATRSSVRRPRCGDRRTRPPWRTGRTATRAFQGTVTWAPTVDSEMLKMASLDLVLARGVSLLLHAWVVAAVQEEGRVRGVVFESKSGRQAILAHVVIDATGDGDVFALAGAPYDTEVVSRRRARGARVRRGAEHPRSDDAVLPLGRRRHGAISRLSPRRARAARGGHAARDGEEGRGRSAPCDAAE